MLTPAVSALCVFPVLGTVFDSVWPAAAKASDRVGPRACSGDMVELLASETLKDTRRWGARGFNREAVEKIADAVFNKPLGIILFFQNKPDQRRRALGGGRDDTLAVFNFELLLCQGRLE